MSNAHSKKHLSFSESWSLDAASVKERKSSSETTQTKAAEMPEGGTQQYTKSSQTPSPEKNDDRAKADVLTENHEPSIPSAMALTNETTIQKEWQSRIKETSASTSDNEAATSPLSAACSAGTDDGEETEAAEIISIDSIDNEETDDAVDSSVDDVLADVLPPSVKQGGETVVESRPRKNGDADPSRMEPAGQSSTEAELTTDDDDVPLRLCPSKTDRKRVHSGEEKLVKLCNGDVATHENTNHHAELSLESMIDDAPVKKKRRPSTGIPAVDSESIEKPNSQKESVSRSSSLEIPNHLPVDVKSENVEFYPLSTSLSPPLTTTPPGVSPLSVGVDEVSRKPKISEAIVDAPVSGASPDPSPPIPPLIQVPQSERNCLDSLDRRSITPEVNVNGNNNGGSTVRSRRKSVTPEFSKEPDVAIMVDFDEDKAEKRSVNGPSSLCHTHTNMSQTVKYSRTPLPREKPLTVSVASVYNHIPSWVRGTMSLLQKVIKFRGNKTKGEPDASAWFLAPVDPQEVPGK